VLGLALLVFWGFGGARFGLRCEQLCCVGPVLGSWNVCALVLMLGFLR